MKNLLLTPLLFLSFAQAETFQCKVVGVTDGDTITCLTEAKKQIKVRLYQIDAPESGQAYGQKAKQALSDMIYGQTVDVENKGLDRYKRRTLGVVSYTEACVPEYKICFVKNINLDMISLGYAWFEPSYGENPDYQQAEQEAKAAKRGLWADKHAVAPWERRKEKKWTTIILLLIVIRTLF